MPDPRYSSGRLLRGGAVVLTGNVAQKLVNVAFLVALTRTLSVDDMGAWVFAGAYVTFFTTVADLGIDGVATRELVARGEERRGVVLGSAMTAKLVAGLLALVVAGSVALGYDPALRGPALLGIIGILSTVPGTASLLLTAEIRPAAAIAVRFAGMVATAVVVVMAARRDAEVVQLVALQTAIGFVTSGMVYVVVRRRVPVRLGVDAAVVRELVVEGLPLAVATVGIAIFSRVDQLMLGAMSSAEELARYGVAVRVVDALNVLPTAVAAVALPALTSRRGSEAQHRLAERGYRWLAAAMLPIAALFSVVSADLVGTLFGARYRDAGPALAILMWAHYFAFAWVLTRQVLLASSRTGSLARLALGAAVANVALNGLLIRDHGARGAAVASLLAYGIPFVIAPAAGLLRHDLAPALAGAVRPAAASAAVLLVLLACRQLGAGTAVLLAVFMVLAPAALVASGSLDRHDLAAVRAAGRRPLSPEVPPR